MATSAPSSEPAPLVLAGRLSIAAGGMFVITVGYLFTVLPATGWDLAMFDAPTALLPWVEEHPRVYQGLWLLYFASQLCLLGVPTLISTITGRWAAVLGTAAVIIAMVGLGVLVAVSPVLGRAYVAATAVGSDLSPTAVLVLHDATADVGKDLRLLSEVLLGLWIMITGHRLRRTSVRALWWVFAALGVWTVIVAVIKIFVPTIGLEDWLGFLLGLGYIGLGVGLVRFSASSPRVYVRTSSTG